MKLKDSLWLALLLKALNWLTKNATVTQYTSPTPVGKRLGGHDIAAVSDMFLILDIRISGRIIILGHFQYS
jgi:hypothetical protein